MHEVVARDSDIVTFNFRLVSPHLLEGIALALGSCVAESTICCPVHVPLVSSKLKVCVEVSPWCLLWLLSARGSGAIYFIRALNGY